MRNLWCDAKVKASSQSKKITISNEKGRLSKEDIERMAKEAEEYIEEDKKFKERIYARNTLEAYIYNMKIQINEKDKLADKLKEYEKEKIVTATKEALAWLEDNQSAEKEGYDEKPKEAGGGSESTEDDKDLCQSTRLVLLFELSININITGST
nr:luminal-binding protein 5 [Tanacetum cinerariifolium]